MPGFPHALEVLCGDITPGQMTRQSALAAKAAKAGVPGASVIFASQSPDGRLNTEIWNDPAYFQWREEVLYYLQSNAKNGDLQSISLLKNSYMRGLQGDNRQEAIKYLVAYVEALKYSEPYRSDASLLADLKNNLGAHLFVLADGMPPDQLSQAISDGKAFNQKENK